MPVYQKYHDGYFVSISDSGPAAEQTPTGPQTAEEAMNEALRRILRKPGPGEARAIGKIIKYDCKSRGFGIKLSTDAGELSFHTKTPQTMLLVALRSDLNSVEVSCRAKPPKARVIVSYKTTPDTKGSDGKIIALEFVPEGFSID